MQRIDTTTKFTDLFGAGKHGFRDGNKALGIAATQLNAVLFNNMQEEICRVIEAAGITLDGAVFNQLLLALRAAGVFTTQATNDSSTKAATTAFVNPGSSLAANGYQKLPSGLIIQWGQNSGSAVADTVVTFPMAFPNAAFSCAATIQSNIAGYSAQITVAASTTGFSFASYSNASARVSSGVQWIAIGN